MAAPKITPLISVGAICPERLLLAIACVSSRFTAAEVGRLRRVAKAIAEMIFDMDGSFGWAAFDGSHVDHLGGTSLGAL